MAYISTNPMFRSLTDAEETEFREFAQENNPPPGMAWEYYHPVCRQAWIDRGCPAPEGVPVSPATIDGCADCGVAYSFFFHTQYHRQDCPQVA